MKKKVSKEEFDNLIRLANLHLTDDEKTMIRNQLSETLDAVEVLNELDTEGVEPLTHPTNLSNITREDKVENSFTQEEALSNAKRTHKGYFVTDAILEK